MNFTDAEVIMAMTHRRDMNRFAVDAQALVDRKDAEITNLTFNLNLAKKLAEKERREKLALELRVTQLRREVARLNAALDEPI